MTYERLCGPQRQPCPNPWKCGIDCHFQCAEVETPHDKPARHFWDASLPGYYELINKPGNAWDRLGFFGRACSIAVVIAVCAFVGVVVLA